MKNRLPGKIGQLILVVLIAILMLLNFYTVNQLQGTGRVVNYAGIVRGASQRLVKLEITGHPDDNLIDHLEEIVYDLQYGGGRYNLNKLESEDFQSNLNLLSQQWEDLKRIIYEYRLDSSDDDNLITASEAYFEQADRMVDSAENYSDGSMKKMRIYEIILFIGIITLIILSLRQTLYEIQLTRKNRELRSAAYLDRLTGIPGRRSCEEAIWYPVDLKSLSYCAVMFDLNNLKQVNDQLGHNTGDKLIKSFAGILANFSSDQVFVGRYGGDEFLMIIHDYEEDMVVRLLEDVQKEVDEFNQRNNKFRIWYAAGYAFGGDTVQKMVEQADEKMYENKKQMKSVNV